MKKVKNEKETSLKQIFSNIGFCLAFLYKLNSKMVFIRIVSTVMQSAANFVPIIFIRFIINEITVGKNVKMTAVYIVSMVAVTLTVSIVNTLLSQADAKENEKTTHAIKSYLGSLAMKMKYSDLEEPRMKDFIEVAGGSNPFFEILAYSTGFLLALLNAVGLSAIILTIHPVIFIFVFGIVAIQIFVDKKRRNFQFYFKRAIAKVFRKQKYLYDLAYNTKFAKETRVNGLEKWITDKIDDYFENELIPSDIKNYRSVLKFQSVSEATAVLQQAVIYIYLAYSVVFGGMLLGDFSMYMTSIERFTDYISGLVGNYSLLLSTGLTAQEIRYCITMSEKQDDAAEEESLSNFDENNFTFEFKNVSFKYPSTDRMILKNINIKLYADESLSLVGINGAGKSTFVKLLCRFYEPTEGEILLNGMPVNCIPYNEYIKLFSVVFQDFKLFSYSVQENITMSDMADPEKLDKCVELAGIKEKILSLKDGLATYMSKQFDSEGVEFSGGEGQKVAIARALYKDAPVVILDEPTSALDPIAEYDIYKRFSELADGKCAVYISHRLSSTRFTDKIAVFSDGKLCEYGNHKELMDIDNGLYRNMFEMQAQYYR